MDVPRGRPSPTRPLQLLFLLALTLFSSACVSIPEVPYVVSGRGDGAVIKQEASCREGRLASSDGSGGFHTGGIDPDGFTLLSWNVMKGGRDGWDEDFARLAAGADLLALQEAYLTEPLRDLLRDRDYRWDMAAAFLNRKRETGVLTGSTATPAFFCVTRFTEPLIVIPKTALTSLYPVAETDLFLLVTNVHLINFTVDTGGYRALLRDLEEILSAHRGPLLLTGDFNTWSGRRMEVVKGLTGRLGLRAVEFPEEGPTAFFGRRVDHVFYRGLEPVEARAVKVSTSDHNPLLVRFRVAKSEGM
jgi:endonuclease/exonuclease/phosphatase (EEP) superfamily protein YafD